jgi:imidazolonepropionase-like amidohydrolase
MLLIQNGLLYTMEKEKPFYGNILIKDGKIERIADGITPSETMEVIDAKGLNVFPGFIDAHSHIGISEEKISVLGDSCNEGTNPVTPAMRAIDAINPMDSAFHNALAVGITGVMVGPGSANAIGGQFAFIKTHGRCIDDMIVRAPAAIKIAFGENPVTNYGTNGQMPATRMAIASLIREELYKAKQYFEKSRMSLQDTEYTMECYRELFGVKYRSKHMHIVWMIFLRPFALRKSLD